MLLKVLEQSPCCEVCSLYDPENLKSPALMKGPQLSTCARASLQDCCPSRLLLHVLALHCLAAAVPLPQAFAHSLTACAVCRGCADLHDLQLRCPNMRRLDASFCTRLTGPAMAAALAGAGRLQEVVLSACLGVDAVTVLALSMMQDLCSLDLSYTGIEVRELCRSLEALA